MPVSTAKRRADATSSGRASLTTMVLKADLLWLQVGRTSRHQRKGTMTTRAALGLTQGSRNGWLKSSPEKR